MATTHRSDLTTEIEKALTDEAYDGGMGPMSETEFPRYVRRLAETAAEVVTAGQHVPSDQQANAAARALIEHDEDRLTCHDHDGYCCPCGEHDLERSEWQRHQAHAALRAAGAA